jgi:cytochrome c oxidase subunit 1
VGPAAPERLDVTTTVEVIREQPEERQRASLLDWLTTTNHKKIGILYIVTTFFFFGVGGIEAMLMRTELMRPGIQFLSRQQYNEIFTLHGLTMILLFVTSMGLGLANYFVPLHIGAPDMAFPRMNMLSYWLFLTGGITIYLSFFAPHGSPATGWTLYPPLSARIQGPGMDMVIMGLLLTSASSIMTAVNIMATVFMLRAPGMTMWRVPVFTWNMVITSLMVLIAFPPFAVFLAELFVDRHFGGHFFDPSHGGSAILGQHLFWFFGHPEVYIMILPFFGVVTEIVPVFSRKPLFGYAGMVLASMAIAALSMTVWAHHMFTTGAVLNPFFSIMSLLIAVPTGVKFFNWIGTMWKGSIRLAPPMLFALGFMSNFLIGGITGVMLASPPFDYEAQDTYFLIAHFHYVLAGGALFGVLAAFYYWFPKVYGYMFTRRLGYWVFAFQFIGFNMAIWPMHILGLRGMQRRVVDYPPNVGYNTPNFVSTIGTYLIAIGTILFLIDLFLAFRRKVPAGDNPWDGHTLEWATTSPPPEHNFLWLPPVRSERPTFDWVHRDDPRVLEASHRGGMKKPDE